MSEDEVKELAEKLYKAAVWYDMTCEPPEPREPMDVYMDLARVALEFCQNKKSPMPIKYIGKRL